MAVHPRGENYQSRFDRLAASGVNVHGEADLVQSLGPKRVLDAGCGTGRVAIELARRGIEVVGVDVDPAMLDVARRLAPGLEWWLGDLSSVELPTDHFDLVVMAGNVMIFLRPGTEASVIANLANALVTGGLLVAGFQLRSRPWDLDDYDRWAQAAGLVFSDRWSTWDRADFRQGDDYAVSVHHKA